MELLKLLKAKNAYLKKFLICTEDLVPLVESGDFSTLTAFQKRRDSILKGIQFFDQKISNALLNISETKTTPSLINAVVELVETKTHLIQTIILADQRIMAAIEAEKNRLQKEAIASDRSQQLVKKFRSSWISESGEQLDGKV